VEAYVDDVVIKTRTHDEFISDLEETFYILRKFRWKLNPTKCIIGIRKGNYSVSSSVTEELKKSRRTSPPLQTWGLC
jgi:hypothetical protein